MIIIVFILKRCDKVFGSLCNVLIKCLVIWSKSMILIYVLHHDVKWNYPWNCVPCEMCIIVLLNWYLGESLFRKLVGLGVKHLEVGHLIERWEAVKIVCSFQFFFHFSFGHLLLDLGLVIVFWILINKGQCSMLTKKRKKGHKHNCLWSESWVQSWEHEW